MTLRRVVRSLALVALAAALCVASYLLWIVWATRTGIADVAGTRAGLRLDAPVTIARDGRGVAHIRAATDHDLFFAEGYAMGSDRLFQMDLTRRYVLGRLAEVLGRPLVRVDEEMRGFGVAALAEATYRAEPPSVRDALSAFIGGINASAATQPVPPEYRALFFRWEPWRPVDAIAVGLATVLQLDDKAGDIIARDWIHRTLGMAGSDAFLPATDPKYDVPANGDRPEPLASLPPLPGATPLPRVERIDERQPIGSNAWAAGASRTTVSRAILANDPHLDLGIPGTWWLVEMASPHYHVAGATLVGTPGVTLGHDEHVAWGVTAGETAAMRLVRVAARGGDELFEGGRWLRAQHRHERIRVRFGRDVDEDVLDSPLGTVIGREPGSALLRDWRLAAQPRPVLDAFLALDRARTVDDGLAAVRALPEPALNVVLIDDAGRATLHLAGDVPADDVAGRWAVDAETPEPPLVPFARAPHVAPSRSALVETSNNRDAGSGPRLAPFWEPPYRAYEVRRALDAASRNGKLTPEALAAPQHDEASPAELELARLVVAAALRRDADRDPSLVPLLRAVSAFDGNVVPDARGATVLTALRIDMLNALAQMHMPHGIAAAYVRRSGTLVVPLRALRERPRGWVPRDDWDGFVVEALRRVRRIVGDPPATFGSYGAQPLRHPLAAFGFGWWNGPTFPGAGGRYAPAVQWNGHGQSFRAVWIAGDWDAGTIDIPAGESGEPGSPHYRDQSEGWPVFARTPLPFSEAAVTAATRSVLTLRP